MLVFVLLNIIFVLGCAYGVGFAEVYYGTDLNSEKLLASIDGEFGYDDAVRFVAEDLTAPSEPTPALALVPSESITPTLTPTPSLSTGHQNTNGCSIYFIALLCLVMNYV